MKVKLTKWARRGEAASRVASVAGRGSIHVVARPGLVAGFVFTLATFHGSSVVPVTSGPFVGGRTMFGCQRTATRVAEGRCREFWGRR